MMSLSFVCLLKPKPLSRLPLLLRVPCTGVTGIGARTLMVVANRPSLLALVCVRRYGTGCAGTVEINFILSSDTSIVNLPDV